jgi:ABC-type lipoprotein release transport system permease subunit
VSIVRSPGFVQSLEPEVVAQLEGHPAVEKVIPIAPRSSMLQVQIPPFASAEASPFAVHAEDMAYLVERFQLELKAGRLPGRGSNEMVISEALAQNRHLKIGDLIGDPDQPAYPGAPSLPVPFVISGIFASPDSTGEGSGWGFISLEFLQEVEAIPLPEVLPQMVVPRSGQKATLDDWLEGELSNSSVSVVTHRREVGRVRAKARQDMASMAVLEGLIALVAAIGLAILNHVSISQRQAEFGVLHAMGYARRRLVGRVMAETALATGTAWALSVMIGLLLMALLRQGVFAPMGLTFDLFTLTPWLFTLPIPVAVFVVTSITTTRMLSKLDAVSIVERR